MPIGISISVSTAVQCRNCGRGSTSGHTPFRSDGFRSTYIPTISAMKIAAPSNNIKQSNGDWKNTCVNIRKQDGADRGERPPLSTAQKYVCDPREPAKIQGAKDHVERKVEDVVERREQTGADPGREPNDWPRATRS